MQLKRRTPEIRTIIASHLTIPIILLGGCSQGENSAKSPQKRASEIPATPTSQPSYSADQLKEALLTDKEVSTGIREIEVQFLPFKSRKAPLCSLSEHPLPGKPDLTFRQFANRSAPKDEIRYVQLIARYNGKAEADDAYDQLTKKARACPGKQHVPAKKIRKNFTLFPHDDTWRTSEGRTYGWRHLRGLEKQVVPRGYTKFNVLHYMYDYAQRGNIFLATVYWERTEPGKSSDPTAKRATTILNKQLKKLH